MYKFFLHDERNNQWLSSDTNNPFKDSINDAIQFDTFQDAEDSIQTLIDSGFYQVREIFVYTV